MDQMAEVAQAIHARFQALPGSDQISTAFALVGLQRWLARRHLNFVLEVGGGIGCASEMLRQWAEHRPCLVVTVENDAWCLDQWRQNVRSSLEVQLAVTPPPWVWDFVVLDGPQVPPGLWERGLAPRAVVFVEGGRRDQRREVREALEQADRGACEASWRPPNRSKGFSVILADPRWSERLWFAAVRLREWGRDLPARWRGRPIGKKACGSG